MQQESMIGHNLPPSDIEIVGQKAKEMNPEVFAQFERLMNSVDDLPDKIENDDQAGTVGDFIKQLNSNRTFLEALRKSEKEPYLAKGRAVDGFFKKYTDKLKAAIEQVKPVQAEWIRKKEEAERIRREEEAERMRLEAEEKLRIAEEKRREAEELRRKQEEEARRAAEEAERKRREAEARAEAERQARQAEIDRLNREAEEARKKLEKEETLRAQAEAEAREKEKSLKEVQKSMEEAEKNFRREEREIRREEREAEIAAKELEKVARKNERESDRELNNAARLDKQAERLDKTAEKAAKGAARVRGDQGSLSTARREWTGEMVSRQELDLEALRAHIPEDALEKAIVSFVRAGGRTLRGATIYEKDIVQVR